MRPLLLVSSSSFFRRPLVGSYWALTLPLSTMKLVLRGSGSDEHAHTAAHKKISGQELRTSTTRGVPASLGGRARVFPGGHHRRGDARADADGGDDACRRREERTARSSRT